MTGEIVGTLLYMAPERFQGQCDSRSDVYGLGITLYELLTLKPPYEAADRHALMQRVVSQSPAPLRSISPAVPHDLETIIEKAIAREPAERYATAAELGDDLQRFMDDKPIRARRASQAERLARWCRRNPGLGGLLTAVALLLVLIIIVLSAATIRLNRERDRTREAYLENRRTLYAAQIHLARLAWEDAQIRRAEEILSTDPCMPGRSNEDDLRGWEWGYLRRLCHRDVLTLKDTETHLFTVAMSPDGRWLATGGWDGKIRLWDLWSDDRKCVILSGHLNEVHQVVFSPDGRMLGSAARDGTARIWELENGRQARAFSLSGELVRSVSFSPDSRRIAAAGGDKKIYQWEISSGSEFPVIDGHSAEILCIAYSPDGHRIASCGKDYTAATWDVESGRRIQTFIGHSAQVSGIAFSPDGLTLASSSEDGTIRLWNASTAESSGVLQGHDNWVYSAAFSPDGKTIASAGDDSTVRVWDVKTRTELLRFRGHIGHVRGVAFHPSGRYVASSSEHGTVKIWDVPAGRQDVRTLHGHSSTVFGVAFSPDGGTLASASFDSTIRLWDLTGERKPVVIRAHDGGALSVAYFPDGRRIASAGNDGFIRVWDTVTGRMYCEMSGHKGEVHSIAIDGGGHRMASAGNDGSVRIWTDGGQSVKFLPANAPAVRDITYSLDGTRLASTGDDGTVRLWRTSDYSEERILEGPTSAQSAVRISPDGRLVVSAGVDGMLTLWNIENGKLVRSIQAHEGLVRGLSFSPDGRRLVSGGWDRWVRLWDTATGRETLGLKNNFGFYRLAFDRGGLRIAAGGHGKSITLYEAESLEPTSFDLRSAGGPPRTSVRFKEKMQTPVLPVDETQRPKPVVRLLEGESLASFSRPKGALGTQLNMGDFGPQWSKGQQLIWQYAGKRDVLKLFLPAEKDAVFEISVGLTAGPDYGVFNLAVEGQHIKGPLDLYSAKVYHTGELSCGRVKLKQGDNLLEITIVDKNPKSSAFLFGLDWIKLTPVPAKEPGK